MLVGLLLPTAGFWLYKYESSVHSICPINEHLCQGAGSSKTGSKLQEVAVGKQGHARHWPKQREAMGSL